MSTITMGTSCLICDAFIPIINIKDGYPRICMECKKRLNKLLYESQNDIKGKPDSQKGE